MNNVQNVLIRARALIDSSDKWLQGDNVRGKRMCAAVAIDRSANVLHADFYLILRNFRSANSLTSIVDFNDAPETTHADVMQAFDKAIAYAGENNAS